uniref:Secreted protein n=2 Tax=Rhizophora mucronata TaxID=61149 RepID=A0A2P2LGH8_RHIMU
MTCLVNVFCLSISSSSVTPCLSEILNAVSRPFAAAPCAPGGPVRTASCCSSMSLWLIAGSSGWGGGGGGRRFRKTEAKSLCAPDAMNLCAGSTNFESQLLLPPPLARPAFRAEVGGRS